MSQTIFAWLGAVSTTLFLVLCVLWAASVLLSYLNRYWESFVWAQRRLAFHEVGKRILVEQHYFHPSVEAQLAIQALGEVLRDSDGWRIEHADDVWKEKMRHHKEQKARELERARQLVAEADKK